MTSAREELINVLAELARRCPNLRYGQLVENMAGLTNVDTWDIEDEELLRAAKQFLETAAIPQGVEEKKDSVVLSDA
jgi:hypothetical protein